MELGTDAIRLVKSELPLRGFSMSMVGHKPVKSGAETPTSCLSGLTHDRL